MPVNGPPRGVREQDAAASAGGNGNANESPPPIVEQDAAASAGGNGGCAEHRLRATPRRASPARTGRAVRMSARRPFRLPRARLRAARKPRRRSRATCRCAAPASAAQGVPPLRGRRLRHGVLHRSSPVPRQLHPPVAPHMTHLRQEPLRTIVSCPHSGQGRPRTPPRGTAPLSRPAPRQRSSWRGRMRPDAVGLRGRLRQQAAAAVLVAR